MEEKEEASVEAAQRSEGGDWRLLGLVREDGVCDDCGDWRGKGPGVGLGKEWMWRTSCGLGKTLFMAQKRRRGHGR